MLISGSGSNLQSIIDDGIPVSLVMSDRPDVFGLKRAKKLNIKTVVINKSQYKSKREELTRKIVEELKSNAIELIVLAGFMTILSKDIFDAYPNRILNIHPSLLPSFKGAHAVQNAIDEGVRVSGCTVHVVTEFVDDGPILAQSTVPVLEDDDEDSLHERIQKEEHRLYPQTIRQFCNLNY